MNNQTRIDPEWKITESSVQSPTKKNIIDNTHANFLNQFLNSQNGISLYSSPRIRKTPTVRRGSAVITPSEQTPQRDENDLTQFFQKLMHKGKTPR